MENITIVYKCERRTDGRWVPGFELLVFRESRFKAVHPGPAADPNQTFATKEEAEAASETAARQWCSENYPGLPVQLI
jgi:hypothetical protein